MPLKSKNRPHHTTHRKEKRTKRFLKVYAPYIPLLLIVASSLVFLSPGHRAENKGKVLGYAHDLNAQGLLSETNKMRLQNGLDPLRDNSALDKAAQLKAADMGLKNYWSHVTPEGKKPWDFINTAEYSYKKAAENLAYGFDNNKTTVTGWMNSPGHRANLLDPDLKEVGFGIVNVPNYQNEGQETLVVALYAQPGQLNDRTILSAQSANQSSQKISYLQSVTQGKAPWSTFITGIFIGAIISYLLVKHMRRIKKVVVDGERFVLHHPLLDLTLIALAVFGLLLHQTVGVIH